MLLLNPQIATTAMTRTVQMDRWGTPSGSSTWMAGAQTLAIIPSSQGALAGSWMISRVSGVWTGFLIWMLKSQMVQSLHYNTCLSNICAFYLAFYYEKLYLVLSQKCIAFSKQKLLPWRIMLAYSKRIQQNWRKVLNALIVEERLGMSLNPGDFFWAYHSIPLRIT